VPQRLIYLSLEIALRLCASIFGYAQSANTSIVCVRRSRGQVRYCPRFGQRDKRPRLLTVPGDDAARLAPLGSGDLWRAVLDQGLIAAIDEHGFVITKRAQRPGQATVFAPTVDGSAMLMTGLSLETPACWSTLVSAASSSCGDADGRRARRDRRRLRAQPGAPPGASLPGLPSRLGRPEAAGSAGGGRQALQVDRRRERVMAGVNVPGKGAKAPRRIDAAIWQRRGCRIPTNRASADESRNSGAWPEPKSCLRPPS